MSTWVFNIIVAEWVKDGHSILDINSLTEKQWKMYFADGCIRRYHRNTNPFKSLFKYGNEGIGAEIILGCEEITEFFKDKNEIHTM